MLNVAAIVGRLTADPELRKTESGVPVCSFTIACDRDYVPAGQEREADFIDIVAWRNNAEFICKHFHKGSWISLKGIIQVRNYEDKDGNKRKAVEILAETASFCSGKETKAETNIPAEDDLWG